MLRRLRRVVRVRQLFLIALFAAIPSAAQDAASARRFLMSAFRLYNNDGKGVEYSSRYYHSSLLGLINADLKGAEERREGPPVAGTDIFCNCQEWEGSWVIKMDLKVRTPQRAEAVVSFSVYASKNRRKDNVRTYKYILIPERGQWRVYDVLYLSDSYSIKSVRKALQEEIAAYVHEPPQ